jgi:AcrR family transcriptional regulator
MEIEKKPPKWPPRAASLPVAAAAPRAPLDRDRIARTALALIDEHGIEQLTMRRLGAELGVEAMALYHYFQNKTSLLDGILDVLLTELAASLTPGGKPLDQVRDIFLSMRQLSTAHPQAFVSVLSRRFRNQRALTFFERLLELFQRAGLGAEQSARYYRVLINFTLGGGVAELGTNIEQPRELPIEVDDYHHEEKYPRVKATMPFLHEDRLESIYVFGLDLILNALKAELAQ